MKKNIWKKNIYINIKAGGKNSKKIRECNSRIIQLETQINSIIYKDLDIAKSINLKIDLKNYDLENQSDFKLIVMKINEILLKFTEYEKKLEDCTVEYSSIDIFNLIKDRGDGTVEADKSLFKSLEDKWFKKFDIIDVRYKQEAMEMQKNEKKCRKFCA